eukprot:348944_1
MSIQSNMVIMTNDESALATAAFNTTFRYLGKIFSCKVTSTMTLLLSAILLLFTMVNTEHQLFPVTLFDTNNPLAKSTYVSFNYNESNQIKISGNFRNAIQKKFDTLLLLFKEKHINLILRVIEQYVTHYSNINYFVYMVIHLIHISTNKKHFNYDKNISLIITNYFHKNTNYSQHNKSHLFIFILWVFVFCFISFLYILAHVFSSAFRYSMASLSVSHLPNGQTTAEPNKL